MGLRDVEAGSGQGSADPSFRQVAESLPQPCWIADAAGAVVWVNEAWIAYTGKDAQAVRAGGGPILTDPGLRAAVQARWTAVMASQQADDMAYPLRGADGRMRPFSTRVTPLRDAVGRLSGWCGICTRLAAETDVERRLRTSDEKLREVFECAADAIFVIDSNRRFIEVNPAACAMSGYSREEMLALTPMQLLDPDQLARYQEAHHQRKPIGDWRIRRKDGSWLELEVSSRYLSDGRRLSVARDISERKQAEARLSASEAEGRARAAEAERQQQQFWEASRDLLAIIAVADGAPRRINARAWGDALGYSEAEILSRRLVDLVHPDDRDDTLQLKPALADGKGVHGFENRYRHADGHWVWLSWTVVREGDFHYAIARDVTEEKLAQTALAASERQFRMLVAGVVDYALFMLKADGTVANWNVGAERIKGYRADEIVGRHISRFYTDADQAAGAPQRALATAAEQGRYEAEAWRVRKDGTLFFANVVIDAIRDEAGELVGFAKITRDITERRNAQLELQRAHERLSQAQKMEAIGQLTGGVAHDFNNLLMVVGGQTQLLRRKLAEEAGAGRALDAIEAATRRGQDLTRHLLAFARRQRLRPEPTSLSYQAQGLTELLGASLGSAVSLVMEMPGELWPIEVDASELELALLNLTVNARDAMPAGGQLTISARNVSLAGGEIDADLSGDFVAISIRDTGQGIPPDILAKVFEPFFTTKAVDKGTGLGLSQVYGFVQQSGGRVTVDSELGEGATFTLYLPRSKDQPAEAQESAPVGDPGSVDVLVVEDNPEVAEVAAGLLEQLGHRPHVVGSAAAALDALRQGERPGLVFSDIVMAGDMDGLELARRIREGWPDLPVLLATGYSQAAEPVDCGFPILPKPYQLADLNRAVGAVLAEAERRRGEA